MRSLEKPLAPVPAGITPDELLCCRNPSANVSWMYLPCYGEGGGSSQPRPPAPAVPGSRARAGGDLVSSHLAGSR